MSVVTTSNETVTVNRRRLVLRGGAIAGAAAAFPAPAIAQGIRELKMATSWPKGTAGLDSSAKRIGQAITAGSGKRIQVSVFAAGELVKPLEVFDAVSSGVVDMYHSAEYYWERRSPAFNFFAAVPFGFTADELAGCQDAIGDVLADQQTVTDKQTTVTAAQDVPQSGGQIRRYR